MSLGEQVVTDYQSLRLSLAAHPMQLLRLLFTFENFVSACDLSACRNGSWKKAAGRVLVRKRPGNGKMVFFTLEDETGVVNIALYSTLFELYRKETIAARLMAVDGRVQKAGRAWRTCWPGASVTARPNLGVCRKGRRAGRTAPATRAMCVLSRIRGISFDTAHHLQSEIDREARLRPKFYLAAAISRLYKMDQAGVAKSADARDLKSRRVCEKA